MKQLIINADDYGFCPSVNKGILKARDEELITDFSFIMLKEHYEQSLDMLIEAGITSCGLHINLTAGTSIISKEPYESAGKLATDLYFTSSRKEDIYKEIDGQMSLLLKAGIKVTHIDSHQNVHLLPVIIKYIKKYKLPIRMTSDYSSLWRTSTWASKKRIAALNGLTLLNRGHYKPVAKSVGQNFYDNPTGDKELEQVKQDIIRGKSLFYELAVHPGICDCDKPLCGDYYTVQRNREFQILKEYGDVLNNDNFRKTSFASLV